MHKVIIRQMGTKVKCLGIYLYPVVRGMPVFFQIICGLGLPPTWHSNTTLPPSTSLWTLGFLMKNGAADVLSVSTSTLPGHFTLRDGTNFWSNKLPQGIYLIGNVD
jgi:hypothetical protein